MFISDSTRYLLVPVSKAAPVTKVRLYDGERFIIDLNARVDFAAAESVFYYDLSPYYGIDMTVSHESGKSFGFSAKKPEFPSESVRPMLHFSAEQGWLNDPNGMVFYEGKYHMFFQHNPLGCDWGNMHWGHAVSEDLINWTELGDVLYPDELGDMYSGSAIIDSDNLLGLKENEHDTLLLYYTAAGNNRELNAGVKFTQCLAYSTDGAKTFHKYAGNPIVPHIKGENRDPKVIRDPESGVYIMALYLEGDEYALLTSENLIDWKLLQTLSLPGDNECPDFYPLTDSDGTRKWVLTGAHDCCIVGDFDIEHGFYNFSQPSKFGFVKAYAAQSLHSGERRIRFSWNQFTGIPSKRFNCEMSVPCEMSLSNGSLRILPAREVNAAFNEKEVYEAMPSQGVKLNTSTPCKLELSLSSFNESVNIKLCGNDIKLDAAGGMVSVSGRSMPLCIDNGRVNIIVIADRYGIEIFDGEGRMFGSFDAEMNGDELMMYGEASLDRMVISTIK
ncbi:MAG: hypothetical protein HFE63_00730 [Clostridiales bacterium]|nr:hypothetical protein [Clostridiales bacterium]